LNIHIQNSYIYRYCDDNTLMDEMSFCVMKYKKQHLGQGKSNKLAVRSAKGPFTGNGRGRGVWVVYEGGAPNSDWVLGGVL